MQPMKIGIVGCGMISDAYFRAAKKFLLLTVAACSDALPERAAHQGEVYGVDHLSYPELLARDDLELIVNLTPPQQHARVTLDTLNAGKHAYAEKPLAVNAADADRIMALAVRRERRVGCAPDTFLGAGQQTARKLIDDGWIGKPLAGTAMVMGRGPERWPQAPFFFDRGAGPMLDLGPYYLTALVNLLGPAQSVTAVTAQFDAYRTFGPEVSPVYQDKYRPFDPYPVRVATHQTGIIRFHCGAIITMIASFDVHRHSHVPIEIYGSQGTIQVPDPNTFGGPVRLFRPETGVWEEMAMPFHYQEESRSLGVAEMAGAIRRGRPHRANGELARHVLELMLAFEVSNHRGGTVELHTSCVRPEALTPGGEVGLRSE
ncbi:MAG: Gfo/Idh/MocA family oxidoreductase [Victivallales bacterium]|nr:Gfo/Idh/MocA family oxidoreductase [Victivallales bacterium]